ncbi:hypothetical protein AB0880_16115 [Micromonospora chersina]|uniref:hypothetical protein n=1 Tax=Micromonospora chersina TaxID=47854 RepID=UPI0034565BB1
MTADQDHAAPSSTTVASRTGVCIVLSLAAAVILFMVAFALLMFAPQATSTRYWDADFGRYLPDTRVWWWSTAASSLLTIGFLVVSFRRRSQPGRWWIWPLSATAFMITALLIVNRVPV